MKLKSNLIKLSVVLLLLQGCNSLKNAEIRNINGMIYNYENEPVSGAYVYLDDKQVGSSDMYGRFYIDNFIPNNNINIKISKSGYETSTINVSLQNSTQLIYVKIYSNNELLNEAEDLIKNQNYEHSLGFISRYEISNGASISSEYLKAIVNYKKKNFEGAYNILENLLAKGSEDPYIYLFIADVCEYGLKDFEKAKYYLEKYLVTKYDDFVDERLRELTCNP